MNTPYSEIYELFKDIIIRDTNFYVKNVTEEEIERIAELRMKKLLNRAIYHIVTVNDKKNFEVDFYNKDDGLSEFLFELIPVEKELIASYMFYCYACEDRVIMWKELNRKSFTDDEVKVIMNSPANNLKEFNNSTKELKDENEGKVKMYLRRDRETWRYKYYKWDFG